MTTIPVINSSNAQQPFALHFALDFDNPQHVAIRAGLNRASWVSARNLTAEQRDTLRAVVRGEAVDIKDIVAVVVAGLHASVTRWGQSMARRSGSQPLLDLYAALPTTSGPVVDAHRGRVEQEQAATITTLRDQSAQRGRTILQQQHEIAALRRDLAMTRPQAADAAANDFAYSLLTPEQRQRVSDFRSGFRAGQSA